MIYALFTIIILIMVISEYQQEPPTEAKEPKKKTNFYRSKAWRDLRYKVLKHYEATCMCCGASRESGDQIHVDHILPRSLFPDLALDFNNMQVLCECCNVAKSNTDFTNWKNEGAKWLQKKN